jgi:N-acetylglucosamine-6-phosphate deacetylase
MPVAFINAPLFTGHEWLHGHAVITNDDIIEAVVPIVDLPSGIEIKDCTGSMLVPAFVDLQIYGAGGKLFSAYPQPDSLQALYEHNWQHGTAACLVCIATQPMEVIYQCMDAIKQYWQEGGKGILGMHLEGPFMNSAKRGAHVAEWIHAPAVEEVKALIQKAGDVIKIITVAPEVCSDEVLQLLQEAGIIISAGHSNATLEEGKSAFAKGVQSTTHLFNAMSPLHHRQPGLPVAALQYAPAASIIPDGIHVHYEMVKLAKAAMGERLFFITDAVTECSIGPYQHVLNGDHYTLPDGTLSGSALTLQQGVMNAVRHCGIPLEEALRMTSLYPAKLMGMENRFGKIAPGYPAPALLPSF